MTQGWFEHLSSTLKDNNLVAYMWDTDNDSFQWAGDLFGFLGLENKDCPRNNALYNKMINPQDIATRLSILHDALDSDEDNPSFSMTYNLRRADGVNLVIEETGTILHDKHSENTQVSGFLKIKSPGTKSKTPSDNIVSVSADLGSVTQGRRSLQQKIEQWLDENNKDKKSYGYVLSVGIDRMALFNDVMGSRYSDEIIEQTGSRLRQIVSESGMVMRINGDVYGIFFKQAPHNEMAAVARHILNSFYNAPLQTSMGAIGIGVSIGGVTLEQVKDMTSVIPMAEMAMNLAKEKGRSCFVSYDEASHKAESNRALLKSADRFLRAIKTDRLRLAFQPIMDTKSNRISFHESLIRLIDDTGTMISAGEFIPAIEELGLSRFVDQHALRMAINELGMFPDLNLSVNVSNLSLNNNDWLRSLVASLRDRPSIAQRLIIEITESAVINDPANTKRIVKTLQDLGARVALDDFGAGYTAFSQLKDLKVDLVKIDKSFIRNIDSEHNHLFVKTLQALAQGVNVKTVGEGAETLAEAKLLSDDGVDYIQGYVYGFPRVERVWLPREHSHRKISFETDMKNDAHDDILDRTTGDINTWQRSHTGL
ncbi:MAG: GGDEF-domain containing protein [Alphaproteobacteria bacterium CG_4_9_14_3_um_filter_47_13]|nr:MAG: GGDEF-domain containing protein [Alphaproteobacteria bacterium CG_4_9_14_3_um_filter_47_13]